MKMFRYRTLRVAISLLAVVLTGCTMTTGGPNPRLCMFVGVDISGSFMNGKYFDDSIEFLSHYIYGHLNGLGSMETPNGLFVS
jgi:hypothetical protein